MRVGKSPDERRVRETSRQPLGRPAPIPIVVMASRKPGRPRNLRSANQNLAGMTTLADQHRRRSFRDGLAGGDADGLAQGGADGHRLAGGGGECLVGAAGHRQPLGSDDSVLPPGNAGGLLVSQAGGVRNDFAAIPTSRPDSIELPVSWKKSAANSAKDADSCMPGRPNWLAQTGLLFRTKKRISALRIGMAMRLANRVQCDALLQTPVGETCRYARGEADCHFSDQGSGSAGM
jgi:hypothetical protein